MSQKIYCSVGSCSYNATDKNECTLKSIQVTPCPNCKKGNPEDESFCGSYCKCKSKIGIIGRLKLGKEGYDNTFIRKALSR